MNAPRFRRFVVFFVAISAGINSKASEMIPRQLWDKIYRSDMYDTASVNALNYVADKYWDKSRDSILKCNKLLKERESRYRQAGFQYGLYYVYALLGGNNKLLYDHALSASYYFQALKIAEAMKDELKINRIKRELGLLYFIQSAWKQALLYFNPLIAYEQEQNNIAQLNLYRYLAGLCHVRIGQPNEALGLLKAAYKWSEEYRDTQRLLEYGSGYASALMASGDTLEARELYEKVLQIGRNWKEADPYFFATVYTSLARLAMAEPGRQWRARDLASMALKITDGKVGYYMPRIEAGQILYQIYKNNLRFDSAIYYLEQWTHEKDSLESKENTAFLSLLQAAHDFDKRETALRIEEVRKRQVMWVLAAVLFLIGLIIFFFYRSLARQKQRTETLLENILPKETISELKTFGHAIPRIHDEVTILFCDVRSFTTIAETLSPASLVSMLDHYFRGFDEIVADLGLEKIKTIGDAYMVAGGLHEGSGNAETVIQSAIRMLQFTEQCRTDMEMRYGSSFRFRVGVHTGSVISGVVGRDKYAYDIWGDAVNVAARMEQNSEEGRINVSGETWQRTHQLFASVYRGKIQAKNKGEVDMYFIEGALKK
jgi:class 3 adenylate cyclase